MIPSGMSEDFRAQRFHGPVRRRLGFGHYSPRGPSDQPSQHPRGSRPSRLVPPDRPVLAVEAILGIEATLS
eukprot:2440225-Prymnesium_polylepis.1